MRLLGIHEPAVYTRIKPEYVGKRMVVHWGSEPITRSMEGTFAWIMYSDLTMKDKKRHWPRYRDHVRHFLSTHTSAK